MTKTLLLMSAWDRDLQLWEVMTPPRFVKISNDVARFHDGTMQLNDLIRKLDTIAMLDTTQVYRLSPDFGLKRGTHSQSFGTLADVVHHYREKYAKKNLDVWDTVLKELDELHNQS